MKRLVISLTIVTLMSAANVFAMKENVINSGLTLQRLNALAGPSKLGAAKFNAAKGAATFSLADYLVWVKAGKPVGAETGEVVVQFTGEEAPPKTTSAVTTQKPVLATKPLLAPKKGVVITEAQKVALEKELAAIELATTKLVGRFEALAMSTGTQEDAQVFVMEMHKRFDAIHQKVEESRKKPDFSSLPHKG